MSDHVNHKPVAPVVVRNDVTLHFGSSTFGKNHTLAGISFPVPVFSLATFEASMKWLGMDWVVGEMNRKTRKIFGEIFQDNIKADEEGNPILDEHGKVQLDLEAWAKEAEKFTTTGGSRLGELYDEQEELQDELKALVDQVPPIMNQYGWDSAENKEHGIKIQAVSSKIDPVKRSIAELEEVYKARAAKRKTTQAKKDEAAAAASAAKKHAVTA